MIDRDLHPDHQRLVERLARLTREKVAPRAAQYDASASFPKADFDDSFFREGFLADAVPAAYCGLGLGPLCGSTPRPVGPDLRGGPRQSRPGALLGGVT
jgi:alkylation response protein AidB-like acyl-CoA dehydrogenase